MQEVSFSMSTLQVSEAQQAFLRNVVLFADLDPADLGKVAAALERRDYAKGELIFRQDDTSRQLYIIFKGKVRIFKVNTYGSETSINIFTRHDVFGEFAALDNKPRSATAKTIAPTALLTMPQSTFLRYLNELPGLAVGVTRLVARKARWTATYAEAIAQYDAASCLLHILLFYNDQFGQRLSDGKFVLDLSLTQADLASLVGARREWINRILRDWQERQLIEYRAGKIIILDLPNVIAEHNKCLTPGRKV
jgi:CRP/FNR family transcriptional regulator